MDSINEELLAEIIMRIIGPVSATGDHGRDTERLQNLDKLCNLTYDLIGIINKQSVNADRYEKSMRDIGLRAKSFMDDLDDWKPFSAQEFQRNE
jgi:hypothetical protein